MSRQSILSVLLALVCWTAGAALCAQPDAAGDPCAIPAAMRTTPPLQGGEPVDVAIDVVVVDIFNIDDRGQTFLTDLVFVMRWKDPRLSAGARGGSLANCRLGLQDLWHPDVRPLNNLDAGPRVLGESVRIGDDGTVRHEKQQLGSYSTPFLMRDFPFDIQQLRVRMVSFSYGPRTVRLMREAVADRREHRYSVAGWDTLDDFVDDSVAPLRVGSEELSRLDYVIHARRQPEYFLWNFVVPLAFIVLMAWTVFWLDPESWGPQIGIATAAAFTLVAFLIALRNTLPPVPYLTRLDQLILGATVLVFLALAEVIVTSRLAQTRRVALAARIDAYFRWIYIALFAGVLYLTLLR